MIQDSHQGLDLSEFYQPNWQSPKETSYSKNNYLCNRCNLQTMFQLAYRLLEKTQHITHKPCFKQQVTLLRLQLQGKKKSTFISCNLEIDKSYRGHCLHGQDILHGTLVQCFSAQRNQRFNMIIQCQLLHTRIKMPEISTKQYHKILQK